jgi:hypothetical protein
MKLPIIAVWGEHYSSGKLGLFWQKSPLESKASGLIYLNLIAFWMSISFAT